MAKGFQRENLYREITDKIIAELEQGVVPWVQPWNGGNQLCPLGLPLNGLTRRSYSGINILLLWSALEERGFRHGAKPTQGPRARMSRRICRTTSCPG